MPVAPPFDDYANHVKDALRTAEFVVDADLDPGFTTATTTTTTTSFDKNNINNRNKNNHCMQE